MGRSNNYSTSKRAKILDYIMSNPDKDVTVKDIQQYLQAEDLSVNITTIYRYLDKLEKDGRVLKRVDDNGNKASFQYIEPENKCHDHLHMKCSGCGLIIHLDCEFMNHFQEHILEDHNFVIDFKPSILYGLCEKCRG